MPLTFADVCVLCGGRIAVWDEMTARCTGYCGSKAERLEDMSAVQRRRMFRVVQRAIAIDTASTVQVSDDVL